MVQPLIKAGDGVWDLESNGLEAAAAAGVLVEVLLPRAAMKRDGPSSCECRKDDGTWSKQYWVGFEGCVGVCQQNYSLIKLSLALLYAKGLSFLGGQDCPFLWKWSQEPRGGPGITLNFRLPQLRLGWLSASHMSNISYGKKRCTNSSSR